MSAASKWPVQDALDARATPPTPPRARKKAFMILGAIAAAIFACALAFGFILAPKMKEDARMARQEEAQAERSHSDGAQPGEHIREAPATYDRLQANEADALGASRLARTEDAGAAETRAPRTRGADDTESAVSSPLLFAQTERRAPPPQEPPQRLTRTEDYSAVYLDRAPLTPLSRNELKAGTIIPAALETAVDTDLAGAVAARVTANVYDTVTGDILLVPQGARLLGRYERDVAYGQRRAFLVWDRILFPNGVSLSLGGMPAVDASGATGLRDRVDYHTGRLLAAVALGGAITTLGELARDQDEDERSLIANAGDAAAAEAAQVTGRLVDRELQVRPTIRIRAGAPVRVLLTRDVILDPYGAPRR
jgi:type IV secretion system protein VirB10